MEAPEGESNRDKSSSSSSPISVVSNFWKEFDLEGKKREPDEKGLRIAENQENSQKNRPKLAESTRDFKEYQLRCQLRGHEDDEQDLKLSELESENGKMKVEHEEFRTEATQSQLFELRAQSDEERATKQSEVNLLMEIPDPIFISYGGSRHTILRLGSTPTEIEVHIPCRFKVPPMLLGCCNGIICLGNYHKMVLWNPCNGTFITIKDTPSLGSYGFGYTEDDYYLIKVLPTILTKPRGGFGHTKVAKVEFFAVQLKSWTTIHLSDDTFEIFGNEWGRFVDGKLYWKGLGSSHEKSGVVICFDLKKKRFQNFGLPKEAITMENVSLAVLSNQICVSLFNPVENKVILWLLKDGGVWETLSIIEEATEYSITASFIPLCMSKDERAVLMVESGVEMIGFPIHKKEKPTKTILHSSKSSPLGSQFILSECAFEATCFKESAVCLASGRDRQKEIVESADEERATKQSEVNLLMDEVERAQTWLLRLEREKGLLRFKLDTANEDTENKKSDTSDSYSILENSLIAKEKIIAELNMELHNIETTLSNEREEHLKEIKKLNTLLIEKEAALEEMKKELQGRPTTKLVDDLRKKVKILQAVGYNSIEAEDWEVATSGEEMSKMESLLLDKNRKMEHELTQLKVKLSEKALLLEKADGKTAELTAKVNEQQKLIQKLEDDILKGYSSKDKKGSLFDDWDLSEARSTEVSENADQKHVSSDQDQSSMLKVICNQRDRFRTRLRETEEEIRQLKERIGALTAELEKTKADNVKLYGKIRYVQDYSLEKVVSRGSKKPAEDLESGFSSDVESKYKKIYEDDINPFAAFSKKERDQRYKELGFRDRITLSSGRFLLGNKYARTFAFFYTIGLHILVFTCLYRMSALSYLSNGQEDVIIGDKQLNLPHAL